MCISAYCIMAIKYLVKVWPYSLWQQVVYLNAMYTNCKRWKIDVRMHDKVQVDLEMSFQGEIHNPNESMFFKILIDI